MWCVAFVLGLSDGYNDSRVELELERRQELDRESNREVIEKKQVLL